MTSGRWGARGTWAGHPLLALLLLLQARPSLGKAHDCCCRYHRPPTPLRPSPRGRPFCRCLRGWRFGVGGGCVGRSERGWSFVVCSNEGASERRFVVWSCVSWLYSVFASQSWEMGVALVWCRVEKERTSADEQVRLITGMGLGTWKVESLLSVCLTPPNCD